MGKGGGSAPAAPDPAATAAAQGAANRETAIAQAMLNMVDQHGPFGSTVFTPIQQQGQGGVGGPGGQAPMIADPNAQAPMIEQIVPGQEEWGGVQTIADPNWQAPMIADPNWQGGGAGAGNFPGSDIQRFQQHTTLHPEEQARLDAERQLGMQMLGLGQQQVGRIDEQFGTPWSFDGMPGAASLDTGITERDQVVDALMHRMDPMFDRDRQALETRLQNQGFVPGTAAWNNAMDEHNRAMTDARMQATLAGSQEQSRMFGLQDTARQRAIQEAMMERNIPLNELSALLGQSGGVNIPQFGGPPQTGIAPTDVAGPINMQYQSQLANWQNQQQAQQSALGNLMGLGGALGSAWIMSDVRLKRGFALLGRLANGLGVYRYRYLWSPTEHVGVMAQEVERIMPAAVRTIGGWKAVDYAALMAPTP